MMMQLIAIRFVGSINFEDNSTTTGHRSLCCYANQWTGFYMITASVMKELKCSTGVIKINDSNIQHYSDIILESTQLISTNHTLFYY